MAKNLHHLTPDEPLFLVTPSGTVKISLAAGPVLGCIVEVAADWELLADITVSRRPSIEPPRIPFFDPPGC